MNEDSPYVERMEHTQNKSQCRKRRAPLEWRNLFYQFVHRHPQPFYLEEVRNFVLRDKIEISTDGLRVKLARYASKGYLKKLGRAEYRFTNDGFYFFDLLRHEKQLEIDNDL